MSTFSRDPHDPAAHESDCPRACDDPAGMPCTCEAEGDSAEKDAKSIYCSGRDGRRLVTCPGHSTFGEDCPAWDAHMADLFVAPDGENEPTLWRVTAHPERPAAVLRRCDIPAEHRDLWERITKGAIRG